MNALAHEIPQAQTPSLAAALAKANAEIHNPKFDKENPHFRSKFASLAAVRDALVPVYAKNGLSILQDLQTVERGVACYTTILHASGEEKTFGPLVITPSKNDAQGIGAAGTYAKRIALQGVACVVGDDDDDGNEAVGKPAPSVPATRRGVTVVNPRGEARANADHKKVELYVTELVKSAAVEDAGAIHQLWDELKEDQDTTIVVWDELKKKHGNEFVFINATLKPMKSTGEGRRS